MSGELEAAGAMATAGLVAGAIEGRGGQGGAEGACLNCGAQLTGPYCSACGQAAHPHRSLVHVFEEFLHGILHFDTKAWRTLPMVLFRPGTLTRNYVYGMRARYISPLALFLFTIFFMFAVFAFAGSGPPVNITESGSVADAQQDLEEARQELTEAQAELDEAIANPDPDQPAGLEERLARAAVGRAQGAVAREQASVSRAVERERAARVARQSTQEEAVVAPIEVGTPDAPRAESPSPSDPATLAPDATVAPEQPAVNINQDGVTVDRNEENLTWRDVAREMAEDDDFVVVQGWDSLNHKAREKLRNPDLAIYKIQQAAYKFSFLLVPISLPFIALLFLWKRGVTLYDHVVFALYSLCFASLVFVTIALASRWEWAASTAGMLMVFGIPIHAFFHLKGAYALGWFSALWRTFFLMIFSIISLCLFLIAIVIVGLTG